MKVVILRILSAIAIIEIVYLIVANIMLNLPLTQTWLNQQKPEHYALHWERAVTWFPVHLTLGGLAADGQTPGLQWQLDSTQVSFSLSLLSLLNRTVDIATMDAENLEVRVRSRLRPGEEAIAGRRYFPPIRDRDSFDPGEPVMAKPGNVWKVDVGSLQLRGEHQFWINGANVSLHGKLASGIDFTTRGGTLALHDGEVDIILDSVVLSDDSVLTRGGSISARFDVAPLVPSQNLARKVLDHLTADARMDLEVDSLGFLDFYLRRYNAMTLDGKGSWRGRLHYAQGKLLEETRMQILASELVLKVPPYTLEGTGSVDIVASDSVAGELSIGMVFDTLNSFHGATQAALFSGEQLKVNLSGGNRISGGARGSAVPGRVDVQIPQVRVDDLGAYQHLLPEKWQLHLKGGTGTLQATATLSGKSTQVEMRLHSDSADLELKQYRITTDLDLHVSAVGDASETASLDLAGTYLKLEDARLTNSVEVKSHPWNAALVITEGTISVPLAEREADEADVDYLMRSVKRPKLRDVLGTMDADVKAQLSLSELSWLNRLFRSPFELAVSGSGEAQAELGIRAGWLARGTAVKVTPKNLKIQVLDYTAEGQGTIMVSVDRGGSSPDLMLDASLMHGSLKRLGKEGSVVEDVDMQVSAKAQQVTLDRNATVTAVDVKVPSAHVNDLSIYNQYLPERLPLRLIAGEASLTSEIRLTPGSATGSVTLQSGHFESQWGKQHLSGASTLDINIAGGIPADMSFDISGSSVQLEDVKVQGDRMPFDQSDWTGRIDFENARVVWKEPFLLDVEASVSLLDTRPFTTMLANYRGKYGWIERLLTVRNITGSARFQLSPDTLEIPYAMVGSDGMEMGAKALINARTREGVLFTRYGKLSGILNFRDGARNFDVLGARRKFDAYLPGRTDAVPDKRRSPHSSDGPRR